MGGGGGVGGGVPVHETITGTTPDETRLPSPMHFGWTARTGNTIILQVND